MPDCGYMTMPNVSIAVPGLARLNRIASQPVSKVPKTALATKTQFIRLSASSSKNWSRHAGRACKPVIMSDLRRHADRVVEHGFQQHFEFRLCFDIEPVHTDVQQLRHVRKDRFHKRMTALGQTQFDLASIFDIARTRQKPLCAQGVTYPSDIGTLFPGRRG